MCKGFPNKSSSAANTPVTLNLRAEQCKHENTRPLDTQPSLCSTVEGGQYCGGYHQYCGGSSVVWRDIISS